MFAKFDTITESRRCSTPKVVPKRTSCVHSPPVSAVRPVFPSEKNSVPKLIPENGACETADVAVESATGTLSNVDELSTTAPVMSLKDMLEGNAENMPPPASTAVIRTPGRSLRQRRHTAAGLPASLSGSSSKKTPKCNSLILKHLSPEESINVLLHSPMVEVRRRTPKLHHTPGVALELPNFDDMDLSVAADPFTDVSLTGAVNPSTPPADLATQEKPAGEINGDIAASDGDTAMTGVLCDDMAKAGGETIVTGGDTAASGGDTAASDGDTAKSNDDMSSEHDVSYFRELLVSETKRLTTECEKWDKVISSTDNLSDDVEGQIRTTVGQAQLLMRQRFKQFSGLVDNCEFGTGEKATLCTDLQGFWDMVYFQVEDVDNKFAELSKLRSNNWVKEQKQQPKMKKIVKKPAAKKPVAAAKSKFGAFLAKMKQQKTGAVVEEGKEAGSGGQEDSGARGKEKDSAVGTKEGGAARKEDDAAVGKEEDGKVGKEEDGKVGMIEGATVGKEMKTFDGGFFSVNSPVHSPVVQREDASSAKKSLSQANSRSGSRANTPGGSCSSKSLLLMSVMKRISQSAQRRSSSPRLSSSDSPRTTRCSLATTPSGGSTGRKQRSRRSLAVCTQSDTPSVFTPRDSSILVRSMEGSSDQKQTDVVTDTCMESSLSRFLIPTKQETEESMDVDQPTSSTDDIDMSSQMKRNLSAEFERQSLSKGKRLSRSGLVTPKYPKSAVKRRRNASEASSRRSTRHSVRFVDANESPVCERLPVTPFNKNSRVPRKRSNSSSYHSDSTTSPTFPDTLVDQSDNDTPVRKLARLTVKHTPTGRAPTPITKMPNLSEADEGETCERPPLIRDDLMSFSPVMTHTPPKQSTMATTPNRTPRRSTRLSLL
ncbi:hypothetical protein LSAT2_024798 [Lamellibrachia satsuma]|nr:hypothetical protein LSAT2_024798 [Lamellibrachia satsuma]